MSGIGFELQRHIRKDTYAGILRAYLAAGIIGSGPWLVSISSMLLVGMLTSALEHNETIATQLFAAITQLISISLVFAGGIQLIFVRFVADRIFEKKPDLVVPNLFGALFVTSVLATAGSGAFVFATFGGSLVTSLLLVGAFVALSNVWILAGLLSGLKAYRAVLFVFAVGYFFVVGGALALERFGIDGLLAAVVTGHAVMVFAMLVVVIREYPSRKIFAFDFLNPKLVFPELLLTGALFNVAVWIDKWVFWLNPITSDAVFGPIRYSIVYDVPISIAYLSVVPGMAVFLVRIETDFADAYERFYGAVREGETLAQLERLRAQLVLAARDGVGDILRIQGLAALVLLLSSDKVLALFGIPPIYAYLLRVDVVGTGFQVVLLGILTVLFYLDYRKIVLYLVSFFALANLTLSLLTQMMGPRFFGMGFAVSAATTSLLGLAALSSKLDRLDYETFMR